MNLVPFSSTSMSFLHRSGVTGVAVLILGLCAVAQVPQSVPSAPAQQAAPNNLPSQTVAGRPASLTFKQAEEIAIKNNPQISVARLLALASQPSATCCFQAFAPLVPRESLRSAISVAPSGSALNNTYGAVGANVEIPIFNGFLYTARAREANLRAQLTQRSGSVPLQTWAQLHCGVNPGSAPADPGGDQQCPGRL